MAKTNAGRRDKTLCSTIADPVLGVSGAPAAFVFRRFAEGESVVEEEVGRSPRFPLFGGLVAFAVFVIAFGFAVVVVAFAFAFVVVAVAVGLGVDAVAFTFLVFAFGSAVLVVATRSVDDAEDFGFVVLAVTLGFAVLAFIRDSAFVVVASGSVGDAEGFGFIFLFVAFGSSVVVVAFRSGDGVPAIGFPVDLDLRSAGIVVGFDSAVAVTCSFSFAVLLETLGSSLDVVRVVSSAVGTVTVTSTRVFVLLGSVVDSAAVDLAFLVVAFGSAVVAVGLGSDVDFATIALVVLLVTIGSAVVIVFAVAISSAFSFLVLAFDCAYADVDVVVVEARSAAKLVAVALAHLQ